MEVLTKRLRRLTPRAIIITGVVATLAVLALFVFGLAPLAYTLLLPEGEALASVAGLVFSIGGSVWTILKVPPVFTQAYAERLFDDAMCDVIESIRRMTQEPADG